MKKQVEVEQTLILVHCRINLADTTENAKKMNYYEVRAEDNINAPDFTDDFDFAMYMAEGFVGKLEFEEGKETPNLKYFKVDPPTPYNVYNLHSWQETDNFNITKKEWYNCPFEDEMYKQNGYWTESHFRNFRVNMHELVIITRDEAKTRLVDGNRIVVINKHGEPSGWILNIFWLIPGIRIENNAFVCTQNLEVK